MRIFICFIVLLFLLPQAEGYGQKKSPPKKTIKPPPPPPPPIPTDVGAGNAGSAGFQVVKIPVNGNYALGMLQKEYDSAVIISNPVIKTSGFTYPVQPGAIFYSNRLFRLRLSGSGIFETDLGDILLKYKDKNGTPDSSTVTDTTGTFKTPEDSTQVKVYPVKQLYAEWVLRYYTLYFTATIYRYDDKRWKGDFVLYYEGNEMYMELLNELARKETGN